MSHSIPIDKKNYPQYIKLGLNIAYYRKLAGFTQEQLAEACGMKYINGQSTVTYFGAFLYRKAEG